MLVPRGGGGGGGGILVTSEKMGLTFPGCQPPECLEGSRGWKMAGKQNTD